MRGQPAATDATRRTSPWPIVVAAGFAVSELGIFFGSVPVAVAGLVLFGGAAAGLAHDAGYGASPAGPLLAAGCVFVALGAAVWLVRVPSPSAGTLLAAAATDGVVRRALAVLVAGGTLVASGLLVWGAAATGQFRTGV